MKKRINVRWQLVAYDCFVLLLVYLLLLCFSGSRLSNQGILIQMILGYSVMFVSRMAGGIYKQIWCYGGIQCYIQLIFTDAIAFILIFLVERLLLVEHISFSRLLAISSMNLLGVLTLRIMYRYAFKCGNSTTLSGKTLLALLKIFGAEELPGSGVWMQLRSMWQSLVPDV